ncbi:MAG: N(4)-(beta-N-acetylglucosaminyl)-L-asparaginase [Balneolaceae bacterium]
MTSRRNFFKLSLLSSVTLVPGFLKQGAEVLSKPPAKTSNRPLFLSTWNHGLAANQKAWEVLKSSGSILDAVEEGVKITEADPASRTVGLYGLPDREGIVTLDASIMKGNGECGGVCFVRQVKHPITLARKVMENTPHVLLAGEGARQFAIAEGMPMEDEVLHPESEEAYEEWLDEEEYRPIINIENHDTIGMIGLDENGQLAGSCTTSGLSYKMHGRVGDSPIIGSGLYVDDEVGAATATGMGEAIMRASGSFLVVELMRQGRSPEEACKETVQRILSKENSNIDELQAGFIAVNKDGEYGGYALRPGFNFAIRNEEGNVMEDALSHFNE